MIGEIPLALYIHTPWCVHKCPYCDFNSHEVKGELDESGYVTALLADLDFELPLRPEGEVETIFIGGGTPSLFSAAAIARLLAGVRSRLPLAVDAEITLEANPGTLEAGRYAGYREAGVNRLSIGVQSFDAGALTRLGRIHGPDEAVAAIESARASGFDNLNVDLMFGLPGQDPRLAKQDVATAIGLNPSHISYYQLTLEPNTLFHAQPPVLPDEEPLWAIQAAGQRLLAEAGYGQYEVSAYARPGRHCRHNLNYWQFGDYLGIGAGAHGKLTHRHSGEVERRWRLRRPADYLAAAGSATTLAGSRLLGPDDLLLEFLMNALRLNEGFELDLFSQRTGLDEGQLCRRMERPIAQGLLTLDAGRVCPTPLGGRFLDDLLARI